MTQLTTIRGPRAEIKRDRYNRPLVIPPEGGKPVAYTRTTTYIDVLEDKYNLNKWDKRMVALGLADRPDLLLSIQAHRDDKAVLDRICDEAKEAARAHAKATEGTAVHALTERVDRGEQLPVLPATTQALLAAYEKATAPLKAVYIEQFCVQDHLKIGGTPDRIVEFGGERYIADIKTGSIEWGALKIAMQLAVYACSQTYDPADGSRGYHEANLKRGIIIHLPTVEDPADATCTLHWVDIEAGGWALQIATRVREARKHTFKQLTQPFTGDVPLTSIRGETLEAEKQQRLHELNREQLVASIRGCTTPQMVTELWQHHQAEWDDELTAIAGEHVQKLQAAS